MKNITKITKETQAKFALITSRPAKMFLLILGIAIALVAAAVATINWYIASILGILGLIFILAATVFWEKSIIKQSEKNNQKALSNSEIINTYLFDSEGFAVNSTRDGKEFSNLKLRYEDLVKVTETQEYLFLFIAPIQGYIISKAMMIDGDINDLIVLLKVKVKNYKIVN